MLRALEVGEDGPFRREVEDLNEEAFPEWERTSFGEFMIGRRTGMADLLAFLDGDAFVGFSYVVRWGSMLYIYYLAVRGDLRGGGYGSAILDELERIYSPGCMALNIEYPDGSEEKARRLRFYTGNGFTESRIKEKWRGYDFELMYRGAFPGRQEVGEFFRTFDRARRDAGGQRSKPSSLRKAVMFILYRSNCSSESTCPA